MVVVNVGYENKAVVVAQLAKAISMVLKENTDLYRPGTGCALN